MTVWQAAFQGFFSTVFNDFANIHNSAQQLFSFTGMVSKSTFQSGQSFCYLKNNQDIKYSLFTTQAWEDTFFPNNFNKIQITNSSALCRVNSDDPHLLDTACQNTWIQCFDRNRITGNHLECHKGLHLIHWKNHLVRSYKLLYILVYLFLRQMTWQSYW